MNSVLSMTTKSHQDLDSLTLAQMIAEAADDRKAEDIVLLKVDEVSYLADYFVLATGFSTTQVRAIANAIEAKLKDTHELLPIRSEGHGEAAWILQDYGNVIVHVFLPQEREFYNLEAFWGHAENIPFESNP